MLASCKTYKVQPPFTDVYKVMELSQIERRCSPSQVALRRRHSENGKTFVSQQFRDATCLSIDKKLQESKEFDDSLGALHSNKELLLKFLNQLDSLFAKHLHDLSSAHEFHYGHVRDGFQSHSGHGQVSDSHTSSHVSATAKKDACLVPRRIVLKSNIKNGQNAVKLVSSANSSCNLMFDF
ncbi:hypothetical protein Nepgr_029034 [Nepenthes gracilis]|uniref:DUF3741 domain-containing protein n=1 Tax=Nepenthes gracilis TaxID=150966 RepID=A0AAD3TDG1_NEPGR|nr:hypothetical protein Nepgr_029034 [Nepenthes gracilis]